MLLWHCVDTVLKYPAVNYFGFFEYCVTLCGTVTHGNGVNSGLRLSWLEFLHVCNGDQDLWAGNETALCRFGFYELAYYKEIFSDWFMEIYCSLEIAHKLLVASIAPRTAKLLFCAFYLVTSIASYCFILPDRLAPLRVSKESVQTLTASSHS